MKTRILIPLMAGLALLCACKGKGTSGYEVVNNNSNADTTSKMDSVTTSQPKLVKTAGIRFKVKNVQQTTENIMALTNGLKGMVMTHQMGSTAERSLDVRINDDSVMRVTSFSTTADMTVKIPSAKLEEFMNQVAHMGIYVNSQSMDVNDKSLDYLSSQLKLKSRAELVGQQKKGKIIIKKPEDVLQLKDDMVDEKINNLGIDDAVRNSIVSLNFYESNTIKKEIIANDNPSVYNLSFFNRLRMALENGWGIFVDLIVFIANLWVFIMAGVGVWMLAKQVKNKKLGRLVQK